MKKGSWVLGGIIGSILFYILEIIYLWVVGRIVSITRVSIIQVIIVTVSSQVIYWTIGIIIVGFLVGWIICLIRRK